MLRVLALSVIAVGCGVKSDESFLVETADCAVVNNFKIDGQATAWNDCRVYWSGTTSDILTVELTTPGSSGSILAPAASWIRASVLVPAGDVTTTLTSTAHPANTLPTSLQANQIALDLPVADCGNVGGSDLMIDTMADVGDRSVGFSMSIDGSCSAGAAQHAFSGGFIVSAAAKAGSVMTSDAATVVTVP